MTDRRGQRLVQAALAVFIVAGAAPSLDPLPVVIVLVAVGLVAAALLAASGWRLLGAALLAGGAVAGLCQGAGDNVGWFALCLLAGWCALQGGARPAAIFAGLAVVVLLVEPVLSGGNSGWAAWITGTLFTAVVGLMGRRQLELIEQLRQAQAGLADRIRGEERSRVARELHDVIGHSLTVSLLHLSSARLAVADDPSGAAAALAQAEELGRQSLTEVRHAVGLLRDGSPSLQPLPGAEQLPALVEGFRRAGADVAYDVTGDPTRLAATTALTLYRILQESLTNAVRHGTGKHAAVRLEIGRRSSVLTVDSTGASPDPGAAGAGIGLLNMRERAEALGGQCEAGPSASGGWQVRAVLPS